MGRKGITAMRRTIVASVLIRAGSPEQQIRLATDTDAVAIGHADGPGVAAEARRVGGAGNIGGGDGFVGMVAGACGGEGD